MTKSAMAIRFCPYLISRNIKGKNNTKGEAIIGYFYETFALQML